MAEERPLICVIEDDPDIRVVLERVLEIGGYRTAQAVDPLEGEALLKKEKPALILLDVMMARMDGYDFCAKLRDDPAYSMIPVVFLTALEREQDKAKAFASGGAAYLNKPIDRGRLLETVAEQLRGRERWRELEAARTPRPAAKGGLDFAAFRNVVLREAGVSGDPGGPANADLEGLYGASEKLGVPRERIARLLAEFSGLRYMDHIHPETLQLGALPTAFCAENQVVAVSRAGGGTGFVLSNPFRFEILDLLKENFANQGSVELFVTEPGKIAGLLKRRSRDETS